MNSMCCYSLFIVGLFFVVVADRLWPIPVSVRLEGSPVPLSNNFIISSPNNSVLLSQGMSRYEAIIQEALHVGRGTKTVQEDGVDIIDELEIDEIIDLEGSRDRTLQLLHVTVLNEDESLNSNTSYEYWIQVENMSASVVGQSAYGAIYGMETFSQLVVNGSLINASVSVHDIPDYRHRGLMIDAGRRFFPLPLVYNLLDAMGYLKMNVLHFHLSDYCRFAVESKLFPSLSASLDGQYYKQDDIRAIVDYARQRGIRVMPEFDMPGHAKGLQPLAGEYIDFCSDNHNEIYGDSQNKSLDSLQDLLAEMAALFPEPLFDIGCDETKELGDCTMQDIKHLEEELFNFIEYGIERTPVAYEEALFKTNSSGSSVVIQAWESYRASDVVRKGNKAIEGNKYHFYFNIHPLVPVSAVWTDIAANMSAVEKKLLLGGEISFWTNDYCPSFQCGKNTRSHPQPPAYWMSDPEHDTVFSQSVGGMIWPRGIAAAGSFWKFNESLTTSSEEFLMKYHAQNQRLIDRGVISCPVNCACDTLTKCGKPYPRTP